MNTPQQILQNIQNNQDEFVAIRRQIHSHPELGFEELKTSEIVVQKLKEWGYTVTEGIGKTGVVGQLKVGNGTKSIGIRADMDALPILEKTGLPYASKIDGKMHACGHDGHTAILLAAAHYLAHSKSFNGTVNLIFQPAEEGIGGAPSMMRDGLFERFPCDYIFALHNAPGLPIGSFVVKEGPTAASSDNVKITLTGQGAHGAMPQFGFDPIVAGSSLVMALQTIVSRNIAGSDCGVVTVGAFNSGHTHNVIPEQAELLLSVRSMDPEVHKTLEQRVKNIAKLQAESFNVKAEVDYQHITPVLVNEATATEIVRQAAISLVGEEQVIDPPQGMMGSEDFSWMLEKVPGCYVLVGNGVGSFGGCMVHNPGYDFNDEALSYGAALWGTLVEQFLK